jgi:hypothetical protein
MLQFNVNTDSIGPCLWVCATVYTGFQDTSCDLRVKTSILSKGESIFYLRIDPELAKNLVGRRRQGVA